MYNVCDVSIKIIEEITPTLKDCRLIFVLGELIVDVLKLDGLCVALILSALLLLLTAFLLSNASTLMLRPDFWFRWFSEPHGHLLNTGDPTLFPRYLHILLASLAVGGLTMAWRAQWGKRAPESGREAKEKYKPREYLLYREISFTAAAFFGFC